MIPALDANPDNTIPPNAPNEAGVIASFVGYIHVRATTKNRIPRIIVRDAGILNFVLPTKMIPGGRITSKTLTSYSLYGPTCDSSDYMKGPFILPNNLKEGDYIEVGQLGAYSLAFRTKFNGFYSDQIFEVNDKPIMSMYEKDKSSHYLVA